MISVPHLAAIIRVLKALPPAFEIREVARDVIVLEDAMVALQMGMRCGLPLAAIIGNSEGILAQLMASGTGCICRVLETDSDLIPVGEVAVCPEHPQRSFVRGPSGMAS